MTAPKTDDGSKKVKNIAAIIYLLILAFLVGGSYLNQQAKAEQIVASQSAEKP